MIDLQIDGQSVDIEQNTNIALTLNIADITELDNSSTGYSKTLSLPMTPNNRRILGFTEQLFSKEQFNNAKHTAKILSNGITVMSGYAQMKQYKNTCNGSGEYSLNIIGDSFDWLVNASNKISDLVSDEGVIYDEENVFNNSILPVTESPLIRFIPIDRGAFYTKNGNGDYVKRTSLVLADYYPFLNVWRLLELIMKGYTLVSSLESKLRRQYITGQITEADDASETKEENDFYVGTTYEETDVNAKFQIANSEKLIYLFNTWDYNDDFFTTGNILTKLNDHILFKPTVDLICAFDITLSFKTTITVYGGFADTFIFGDENHKVIKIFKMTDSIAENGNGFPIHSEGNIMKMLYFKIGNVGGGTTQYKGLWIRHYNIDETYTDEFISILYADGCCAVVSGYTDYDYFFVKTVGGECFFFKDVPFLSDTSARHHVVEEAWEAHWYDTDGKMELTFNVSFKTLAFFITKDSGIKLQTWFKSSQNNGFIQLSIGNDSTIKPNFRADIAYGEKAGIDILGGERTQLEFVQEMRTLYNLMFYTNSVTKEIFIEPRCDFYIDKL